MDGTQKYPGSLFAAVRLLILFMLITIILDFFKPAVLANLFQSVFSSNKNISDLNIDFYFGHLKWAIRFFIVFFYINWRYHLPWSDMFRLSSFPYFILIPIIVISIGNNFFCEEISSYFEEIKRIIHYSNPAKSSAQFIMPNIGYEYFYDLLFFLVIGPILEEVLFRGIIL